MVSMTFSAANNTLSPASSLMRPTSEYMPISVVGFQGFIQRIGVQVRGFFDELRIQLLAMRHIP